MTVGMLSAMEAVRQSWLKEEEEKMMLASASGAAAAAAGSVCGTPTARGQAVRGAAGIGWMFSSTPGTDNNNSSNSNSGSRLASSPSFKAGCSLVGNAHGAANAAVHEDCQAAGSSSCGYRRGASFKIPDIPALKLDEL
jgi:hypothetical protein